MYKRVYTVKMLNDNFKYTPTYYIEETLTSNWL